MALPATHESPRAYSSIVEDARRGRGQDRIAAVRLTDRTIFVVADGAGGVTGGAAAAEAVCKALVEQCRNGNVSDWSDWLAHVDQEMALSGSSGLTAAVVVDVADDGRVTGASAGDCEAWSFATGAPRSLTAGQVHKPLLGEGMALPVPFEASFVHGTLVVATDGLWKYANREKVAKAVAIRPLQLAAETLVEGLRLKSGALQDDVAIVICEVG